MQPVSESADTRLASPDRAVQRVLEQLEAGQALSLLRVGDGEGILLNRPNSGDPSLDRYLQSHFGDRHTPAQLERLADRLALALRRASVIGIRNDVIAPAFPADISGLSDQQRVTWARDNLRLRAEESAGLDPGSAYRLMLLGHWMAGFDWPEQALLTSAWIHFDWLESGFLADLAVRQGRIGLVTGRRGLAPIFRAAGVEVDEWTVPLRFMRRDADWTPHFPDRYEELLDTLTPAFPGQLFFVGAGICGKVYCDVIADRGGVALDIGAVCDAWLGNATRPRVAFERWGQDAVPETLLLERQLAERAGAMGAGGKS